ncbi:MAG: hypothetical protein ACREFV_07915 [Acetobacteraceae bacterium]
MFKRYGVVAAAATFLIACVANAQPPLAPAQSQSIVLGPVSGGIYYTAAPDGDHVIATLQCSLPPCIVRFAATLTHGQSVTLSTPRGVGQPPIAAQIERRGNQLLVESVRRRVATEAPGAAQAP